MNSLKGFRQNCGQSIHLSMCGAPTTTVLGCAVVIALILLILLAQAIVIQTVFAQQAFGQTRANATTQPTNGVTASTAHVSASKYAQVQFSGSTANTLGSSTDNLVKNRLRQVALGNAAKVRTELPALMAEFKGDPGIEFLNATLMSEPSAALPAFERIVKVNPRSIWADDAQWRVVQLYAMKNDTVKARAELQDFRKEYPNSEFLLFASEIVKNTVGLPPVGRPASAQPVSGASAESVGANERASKNGTLSNGSLPAASASATKSAPMLGSETVQAQETVVYALQVGLFTSESNAAAEVQKFLKARMRADVTKKNIGSESRFAVLVGEYSSRENAEKARPTVQKYSKTLPFVVVKTP